MTTDKSKLVDNVMKKITGQYGLEDDFIQDLKKQFLEVLAPYYVYNSPPSGKKGKKKNSSGKPRKKTAYNVFVKVKMQTEAIKAFPQKERMGEIGKLWKTVTDEEKADFQKQADALNVPVVVEEVKKNDTSETAETTEE